MNVPRQPIHDGHTMSVPRCKPDCPDAWWWPTKNLILNQCPGCGYPDEIGKTWRLLVARRLIDDRSE